MTPAKKTLDVRVDEEQPVEPTKHDGVDGEEVTRDTAASLNVEKLGPRWSRSS